MRFRVGHLAVLVKLLAEDRVGVTVEPPTRGVPWSVGLTAGNGGVWNFAVADTLPEAVDEALRRVRRGEHVEVLTRSAA